MEHAKYTKYLNEASITFYFMYVIYNDNYHFEGTTNNDLTLLNCTII